MTTFAIVAMNKFSFDPGMACKPVAIAWARQLAVMIASQVRTNSMLVMCATAIRHPSVAKISNHSLSSGSLIR